jgi:hypothetical protein
MYHPQKILSDNSKTHTSINLPTRGHCRPTKVCTACCYAKTGPINWSLANRKKDWVSKYLLQKDITELIRECQPYSAVRLSATGDLLKEHIPQVIRLAEACPDTQFWGMTRKTEIARAINSRQDNLRLLVTVDAASPPATWEYQGGKMCYGPRRAGDVIPVDKRILTVFPYHFIGRVVGDVPADKRDCPAVRHTVKGCLECGRCWRWK